MFNNKDLILYFVRRTIRRFPREWRDKLGGLRIYVEENSIRIDKGRKREFLGYYDRARNIIVYYSSTRMDWEELDIYKVLRSVQALVEHELFHAVSATKEEIEEFRKNE